MVNALPLRILYEDWGEATLPDGTTVRFRPVVGAAFDDGHDDKGLPKFGMRMQPQFMVLGSPSAKGQPRPVTKRLGPIANWTSFGQGQSSYEVNGTTVLVKMALQAIHRTDGFDPHGDPAYEFKHGLTMEFRGPPPAST